MKTINQKRHNRVIELIFSKVNSANQNKVVLKDTPLKPSLFFSTNQNNTFSTDSTRPDIVTIDADQKYATIIEVSIPFDGHMSKTFQSKFDKYFPLSLEINDLGFRTDIIVLVVGSLGHVHSRFIPGLLKNKINKSEAKFLARYCSTSAMLGSFFAWRQRCRFS